MRVLIQGKIDLLEVGGGDRVQIENTAYELEKLGVTIDIIPGFNVDYSKYDLVHLFQLDWTPETYLYAIRAKKQKKPLVLSPIHHSVKEVSKFDTEYTFDLRKFSKILFQDQYKRDTLKNVYKALFDRRKIYPTLLSILLGLKRMQKATLELADIVLVQTSKEAEDLIETYDVTINWEKVVNGVGEQFQDLTNLESAATKLSFENYILCIGRIEARKNQLNIVDAVEKIRKKRQENLQLVFIGRKSSKKHPAYVRKFDKKVVQSDWIHYLGEVPYRDIPLYLKYAKVGVSASWFETTGLTSLEALYCGTNAVAAGERAREYLGNNVTYCEPNSVDSIASAIEKEYYAPRPGKLSSEMVNFTWENAAKKTFEIYKKLLKSKY